MTNLASTDLDEFDVLSPPTQDQLICDDGIPMETERHKLQMDVLVEPLRTWLVGQNAYVGGNMFVYFSPNQVKTHDFRGPDVFVVRDVSTGERKSWVVWEEGKAPDVVIELLSESTFTVDQLEKKQIYQNRLRVPEYIWFDPFKPDVFAGFSLEQGVYQPMSLDEQNRIVCQTIDLALVRWTGDYQGISTTWLRWSTLDGTLLPTDRELKDQETLRADQEAQRANQEAQRADQEAQRADRLSERLRALGLNPDDI